MERKGRSTMERRNGTERRKGAELRNGTERRNGALEHNAGTERSCNGTWVFPGLMWHLTVCDLCCHQGGIQSTGP